MFVPRTGRRRWLPVALAAAGLVVLTACGGGGGEAAPASGAPGDGAFAECMTEHGVPAPEREMKVTGPGGGTPGATAARGTPPPPPEGVDPDAWTAALEACEGLGQRRTVGPADGGS
ncbi:hypothetical protein ACU61A_20960 [Pseudonocardia sichuanensis]